MTIRLITASAVIAAALMHTDGHAQSKDEPNITFCAGGGSGGCTVVTLQNYAYVTVAKVNNVTDDDPWE